MMPRTEALAAGYSAVLLIFGLHLLLSYFSSAFFPGFAAAVLLSLLILICTGVGRLLLRAFGARDQSESEKTLIGCTLGLGVLSQGMFVLGVCGLIKPWAVMAMLSGLWIFGFTEMRDFLLSLGADRNLLRDRPLWIALIGGFCALVFWTTWMPPHQYDALVYHLSLPAAYVRAGKIIGLEHLLYSYFPQNGEMLFTLALVMHSDILAQMFSWLAMMLCVLWIFEMGKREMPLTATLVACVLVSSHTAVMLLSSVAYVEAFAMLWITAAVLSFSRWIEISGADPRQRGWLKLAGLFAGLGVGTKYYAGICPAVLTLFLAARTLAIVLGRETGRRDIRRSDFHDLIFFTGVTTLFAAPWLARNWIALGNPFFPFFYQYLPHWGIPWGPESGRNYFSILSEYGHPKDSFLRELLQFPYLGAAGSTRFGGGMDVLGNLGWGLLVALVPASVFAAAKNKSFARLLVYCGLHWLAWFCTGVVLRFLVVIVPVLSLVAAAGLNQLWSILRSRGRAVLVGACSVFIATHLGLFLYVHTVVSSWAVLLGSESREEYLARKLDYFPCARYAREHLAKNDKIVIVGDQRSYYIDQDNVATTVIAPNRFVEWANRAESASDLARLLRSEGGFTHLMVVPREARRLKDYQIFNFSERGYKNWTALESSQALKQVFAPGSCALFEVAAPRESARSMPAPTTSFANQSRVGTVSTPTTALGTSIFGEVSKGEGAAKPASAK